MLTPRLSVAPSLAFCLSLGLVAIAGAGGCQGPDIFLRKGGSGGSQVTGIGGFIGSGVGGHGTGGTNSGNGGAGTGGGPGTGGHGTGGNGTGGNGTAGFTGTGGVGTGGARDAGADQPGVGGAIVTDGGADSDAMVIGGTGPCAGLCTNPVVLSGASSIPSTAQGAGATCYEATGTYMAGNCGNFVAPRTFSVNGVVVPVCTTANGNGGGNFDLPATRLHGGYCFQSLPGQFPYAYFGLY